ncbi:hypothetical protein VPH35_112621 [Triticum aestivum]
MAAIDFCCYARPTSSPVVASEPSPIPTPPIPATHGERAAPLPASPAAPRTPRGGWRCWERWGARAMTRIGSCWTSGGRAATCRKVDKSCGGAASGCWNRQDPVLLPAASRAGTGDPRSYYRLHLGECKLRCVVVATNFFAASAEIFAGTIFRICWNRLSFCFNRLPEVFVALDFLLEPLFNFAGTGKSFCFNRLPKVFVALDFLLEPSFIFLLEPVNVFASTILPKVFGAFGVLMEPPNHFASTRYSRFMLL